MIKSLTTCLLLAVAALHGVRTERLLAPDVVRAGLADSPKSTGSDAPADHACAGVSLSRNLKYGDSDRNVLDVATTADQGTTPRPVLLFVAGQSFSDDGATLAEGGLRDQAMCLAAQNGLVGVTMRY